MKDEHINRALVKRLREERGLSQRAAAQAIGVSFGTVQNAEYHGRISMDTLSKFAQFYGFPKSTFLAAEAA